MSQGEVAVNASKPAPRPRLPIIHGTGLIVGFDDDLAGEATRISNRLHGLLTQIHPSLERVLGPRIQHPAVLLMLDLFVTPATLPRRRENRSCVSRGRIRCGNTAKC